VLEVGVFVGTLVEIGAIDKLHELDGVALDKYLYESRQTRCSRHGE